MATDTSVHDSQAIKAVALCKRGRELAYTLILKPRLVAETTGFIEMPFRTPLMYAAEIGYKPLFDLLISNGGDLLYKNKEGITAEFVALSFKNHDLLKGIGR